MGNNRRTVRLFSMMLALVPLVVAGVWYIDSGALAVFSRPVLVGLALAGVLLAAATDSFMKVRWPAVIWAPAAVLWAGWLVSADVGRLSTTVRSVRGINDLLPIMEIIQQPYLFLAAIVVCVSFLVLVRALTGVRVHELALADDVAASDIVGADRAEGGSLGTARFMTEREAARILHDKDYGLIVGCDRFGGFYRYSQPGHCLTASRTRGGKGVSLVIPNLLDYPGPVIVLDPKGENYSVSNRRRREIGHRVRAIDPYGITDCLQPSTCNVLAFLDAGSPRFVSEVRQVVEMLVDPKTDHSSNDPFWPSAARNVLTMFIIWVVTAPRELLRQPRNLYTVRELATCSSGEMSILLAVMAERSGVHPEAARLARSMQRNEKRTNRNVAAVLDTWLAFLGAESVAKAVCKDDFEVREVIDGTTDVYLCFPLEMLEAEPEMARVIIGTILFAMMRARGGMKERVLFMLDEFPKLGRMDVVVTGLETLAGMGVTLWLIMQSPWQLVEVYSEAVKNIIAEQCAVKQFFGIEGTYAEDVAKLIGETTVIDRSTNEGGGTSRKAFDVFGSKSVSGSESVKHVKRHLMTPDQVRTMAPDDQVLVLAGEHPLRSKRVFYYNHPAFAGMFDKNPYMNVVFGGQDND